MEPCRLLTTSSEGLSATTEIGFLIAIFLRFKDFVSNHEHGRVKAKFYSEKEHSFTPNCPNELSVKRLFHPGAFYKRKCEKNGKKLSTIDETRPAFVNHTKNPGFPPARGCGIIGAS